MIKKLSLTAAALALTVAVPMAASAASAAPSQDGWYASVLGGLGFTPKINANGGSLKYKTPSWQIGAALGYKSGQLRYEGEFLYQDARMKSINTAAVAIPSPGIGFNGDTDVYAGMANVYYDFDSMDGNLLPLNPYVGVGIGYAHVRNKATLTVTLPGVTVVAPVATTNDNVFAYQGIAGLNYNFDNTTSMQFDYRYFGTSSVKAFGKRWTNHTLNLGLTMHFDMPQVA